MSTEEKKEEATVVEPAQDDKVKLETDIEELEKKKAGLEEDVKRNLDKVVDARQQKRTLSTEEIDEVPEAIPQGDMSDEHYKELRKDIDLMKATEELKKKTVEKDVFQEIYKRHPNLAPENDPTGAEWNEMLFHLRRIKGGRGSSREDMIADVEDAILLKDGRDKILDEGINQGRRNAEGESMSDIGGTSTTSNVSTDPIGLSIDEKEISYKMFPDKDPQEAEKIYLQGKKIRQEKNIQK